MKKSVWLPKNCCEIPLPPYAKERRSWSIREQRLMWYQILTYVAFPDDFKGRRRATLLLFFQAYKRTRKATERRSANGKGINRLTGQMNHIANLLLSAGSVEKFDLAPQRSDFEAALRNRLRQMHTVRVIVSLFLRMHHHMNAGGPPPSIQKAKDIINEADYQKFPVLRSNGKHLYSMLSKFEANLLTHFKKKNLVDDAWKRYASVSHLVYGILETGEEVLFDRGEAAKRLPSILSKALYAQNVLLTFKLRETKRATRDAENMWRLPDGIVDIEEDTLELPPLSDAEFQALKGRRAKSDKGNGAASLSDGTPPD